MQRLVMAEIDFSALDYQLAQVVGVILEAKGFHYSQDFLEEITNQGILYFHELVRTLGKFTELQRRTRPSASDLEVTLSELAINPSHVYDTHNKLVRICVEENPVTRKQINTVSAKSQEIARSLAEKQVEFDESDPSLPFYSNEHYEITELVPQKTLKPSYIPDYFPELPPDFTYHSTPQYMKMLTDLKEMRLKLVSESRMQENSLYVLMDNEEIRWKERFEHDLSEMEDEKSSDDEIDNVMSESETKVHTDVESPVHEPELEKHSNNDQIEKEPKEGTAKQNEAPKDENLVPTESQPITQTDTKEIITVAESIPEIQPVPTSTETAIPAKEPPKPDSTKFDIEDYARKRLALRRQREDQLEERHAKRKANVFLRAEQYFSPYAVQHADEEIKAEFRVILQQEFKLAINSIRKAEIKKKQTIEKILQERAKKEREREQEREKVQFGFSFHANRDSSSESDSEDEFGDNNNFPSFGFGQDGEGELINGQNNGGKAEEDQALFKTETEGYSDIEREDVPELEAEPARNETEFDDHAYDMEVELQTSNDDNTTGTRTPSAASKTVRMPSVPVTNDSENSDEDESDDDLLEAELENAMFEHSQSDVQNTVADTADVDLDSDSDVDMEDV